MIEEELRSVMKSQYGSPMIFDTCEFARAYLYENFAKNNKWFNKRTHLYQEEGDAQYIEEEDVKEVIENLEVKETYTSVTLETFLAWQNRFKAERAATNQRDPKWKAHQFMLSKPSGKKIFENAKGMEEFFDDNKNEDDDEDVDILKMAKDKEDQGSDDEDMEIDEDAFGDDDDLDVDLGDESEDDEEKEMAKLFL